jgi:hypothetical protein
MKKGIYWALGLLALAAILAAFYEERPSWIITATVAALATGASFCEGEKGNGLSFVGGLAIVPAMILAALALYATAVSQATLFANIEVLIESDFSIVNTSIVAISSAAAYAGHAMRDRRHEWHYDDLLGRPTR